MRRHHSVVTLIDVSPAIQEWELVGLSAPLPEVETWDSAVAFLEAEAFQEEVVEDSQEEGEGTVKETDQDSEG